METGLEIRLKQFDMLNSLLGELQKGLMTGTSATAGLILLGIAGLSVPKTPRHFLRNLLTLYCSLRWRPSWDLSCIPIARGSFTRDRKT
jgi:hypothetical protein